MELHIVHSDGSVVKLKERPAVQYYRWVHDIERRNFNSNDKLNGMAYMGDGYRLGPVRNAVMNDPSNPYQRPMPEVYRVLPDQVTALHDGWIRMWRQLNPELNDKRFCTLLDNKLAFSNGTGWPGRRNVILGEDLGEKFPAFHAPIVTGGAVFKGTESYSLTAALQTTFFALRTASQTRTFTGLRRNIVSTLTANNILKIDNLLSGNAVPAASEVLADLSKWFWMTAVTKTGQVNLVMRVGIDNQLHPVRIPFITKQPVYVPLSWVHKLPPGFIPPAANWMPEKG